MNQQPSRLAMAAIAAVALAVPFLSSFSLATAQSQTPPARPPALAPGQEPPPAAGPRSFQGGPPPQPGQGPQFGQGRPMGGGMMGGGSTAMVEDGTHLFIVQGNRVFKLNKSDLRVVAQGELPAPRPSRAEPAVDRPGGGGPPPPPAPNRRFGG